MKQLLFLTAVLLTACNKPIILTETKTLYYRIQQVDVDGTITTSPIRKVNLTVSNATNATTDDDDHDHHDQGGCHPVAIKFETFVVTVSKDNSIRVSWYIIERSTDSKNWVARLNYIPDLSGKYTIIDTYDVK